jgi:hypothetical protein
MSDSINIGFKLIFLLFGAVFVIGGLLLLFGVYRTQKKVKASQTWPETIGKVTSAEINKERYRRGDSYIPKITYAFSVLGADFTGIFILDNQKSNQDAMQATTPFKVGTSIPIHYNPEKPQEHVSEQDKIPRKYLLVIAGMLIFGVVSLWLAFQ